MTDKTLTLRLAVPEDAERIAAMSRNLVEYGLRWTWRPGKVRRHIEQRDTTVLAAMDGRRLAGFAIMTYGDDKAYLHLLAVDPDYRHAGVGRRMVEWLEKSARVAGVFTVNLEVRDGNHGARQFYQQLGYCETERRRGYYQGVEDALRLHHDLAVPVYS